MAATFENEISIAAAQANAPDRDYLARRGLKLRHLRFLVALRDLGQVSAAAATLNMSQPAASRLLSEIERIAGAPLHERHPRGVALLPAGQRLADRARNMLAELDAAGRELLELREGARGAVRIGAVTGPALEIVVPTLKLIRRTHPEIEASVVVEPSVALIAELGAGRLDFVIGRLTKNVSPNAFEAVQIGEEPAGLMVRRGHPLVLTTSPTLADCMAFDWVMQPQDGLITQTMTRYFDRLGVAPPHRVIRTSSLLMTLALVSQTDAIAPAARSAIEFCSDEDGLSGQVTLLPVARDLSVPTYSLIKIGKRALSPAAAVVYDVVLQRVADLRDGSPPPAR